MVNCCIVLIAYRRHLSLSSLSLCCSLLLLLSLSLLYGLLLHCFYHHHHRSVMVKTTSQGSLCCSCSSESHCSLLVQQKEADADVEDGTIVIRSQCTTSFFRSHDSRSIPHGIPPSQYRHWITHPNRTLTTTIAMKCGILTKVHIRTKTSKVRQRPQRLLKSFSCHLIGTALLASWTSLGDVQYNSRWTSSDAYCFPCILVERFGCVSDDNVWTKSAHGELFVTLLLLGSTYQMLPSRWL